MVSRIKQLLDWQQLSPTHFADRIGVGRPVVSHILSERNKASLDVVRSIKAAFPQVSTDWLLDGTGDMLVAEAAAARPAPASPPPPPASPPEPVPAEVPASPPAALPLAPPVSVAAPAPPPALPDPARPAALAGPPARFRAGGPASVADAGTVEMGPARPAGPPPADRFAPAGAPRAAAPETRPLAAAPVAAPAAPPATEAPPATAPIQMPVLPSPAATDAAMPAQSLAEPGKAIRRIVIFYRDGSFADYQPE